MNKKRLCIYISMIIFFSKGGHSAELYFPPELLSTGDQQVANLSHFQGGGIQLPGEYLVDVYLNKQLFMAKSVRFIVASKNTDAADELLTVQDNTGLKACLARTDLLQMGIKVNDFPALAVADKDACINLEKSIPGAFSHFNFTRMRLEISIPQAAINTTARGYIEPELWDEGINAALLNYHFSGSNNSNANGSNSDNYYLNLTSGLNLGAWRFRDYRIWSYYNNRYSSQQQWQRVKTYVARNIIPLRSALTIGESTTNSDIFDSLSFRGIQINTDDSMYPDSRRGYAPTIRGVADSNAQVSIRQNGYNVYQTTVSPGAFEINDLYPMYSSGDLEVSVREANGNTTVFTVPYSSVPILQREGRIKYSLSAGKFQNRSIQYEEPTFAEGTLLWGLPHSVTAYGGMQFSDNYLAAQFGMGFSAGLSGAVSVDVTHADSKLTDGSKHQGQSVRFLYAHSLNQVGTTFRLTGYRYSTKGFHTLNETALKRMSGRLYEQDVYDDFGELVKDTYSDYYSLYNTKRARLEANISQNLGSLGSMHVTGVRQTFWGTSNTSNSLQTGFSSSLGAINYSFSYGYNKQKRTDAPSYNERTANLSVSLPLGRLLSPATKSSSLHATYHTSKSSQGGTSHQAGLGGSTLDNNNLSWHVSQGYVKNQGYSGNTGFTYKGANGNTNAGYSYGSNYKKISYGLNGSMLLHSEGLTPGQSINDSAVLIAAPGASGINLKNERGVKTDSRGYAIKPYVSPYRENKVSLDINTLDDKTEIDSTVTRVVPTKGAIVRANFKVHHGHKILISLTHNGKPVPYGSVASHGSYTGIVGDAGQVYMTGMPDKGNITIKWGESQYQQCNVRYDIQDNKDSEYLTQLAGECL